MSTRLIRPSNIRVRAPRLPLDLRVESKTIGTDAAYDLNTVDVSRSGLLLSWNRKVRVPFNVNTILEMKIDPGCSHLDESVSCLGKVVRREGENGETQFGIQIVQIDNTDLNVWEGCLNQLESKFGFEFSNKVPTNAEEKIKKKRHSTN